MNTAFSAPPPQCRYDETPTSAYHIRVSVAAAGGQLSDGYVLGTIGIALSLAKETLHLDALWVGLIGGASLAGLFFGCLFIAPLADRIGRRPLFTVTMAAFTVAAVAQFWIHAAWELLVLRVLLGLAMGVDYVVGNTVVMEFAPRRTRGRLLSLIAFAWVTGFTTAYVIGTVLASRPGEPWRWILLSGAVPSLVVLLLRLSIPETPPWLVQQGRQEEAAAIIFRCMGSRVELPQMTARSTTASGSPWKELFQPAYRKRTLVGATFYTAQVIPYFAMGTFIPIVLAALGIRDAYEGGLIFDLFLLLGSAAGLYFVDRISRRGMLIGGFYTAAVSLFVLTATGTTDSMIVLGLFAVFAFVLAASSNLECAYLPELFPTRLRASGVGLATAASRIGSATSTFLLPISVETMGVRFTLGICVAVLAIGGVVCQLYAPETRGQSVEDDVVPSADLAD